MQNIIYSTGTLINFHSERYHIQCGYFSVPKTDQKKTTFFEKGDQDGTCSYQKRDSFIQSRFKDHILFEWFTCSNKENIVELPRWRGLKIRTRAGMLNRRSISLDLMYTFVTPPHFQKEPIPSPKRLPPVSGWKIRNPLTGNLKIRTPPNIRGWGGRYATCRLWEYITYVYITNT